MKIDPDSGTPIYLQIIDELKTAVLSGRYRDGDRVLPVRELAVQLRVNPNTVAKAFHLHRGSGGVFAAPGTGGGHRGAARQAGCEGKGVRHRAGTAPRAS